MNIYVGNLPKPIGEDKVRNLFEQYGQVTEIKLIKDQYSGEMRGFGFVEMPNRNEALAAIEKINGTLLEDNKLVVNQARPREERSGGGGRQRGSGGGGNFRSSRYSSW
jgi:cold-inducible RNA-binding protein